MSIGLFLTLYGAICAISFFLSGFILEEMEKKGKIAGGIMVFSIWAFATVAWPLILISLVFYGCAAFYSILYQNIVGRKT